MSKEASGLLSLRHLGGDFFRFLRQPGDQRAIWGDYFQTRRETAFLREHAFAPGKQTVLVASMSTWAYQIKIEAMLALGLRLHEWRPVILMRSRQDRWSHRYFRAFGLTEFVYWDDFGLEPAETQACAKDAATFLAETMTFRSVKNWSYRGCWIGPQILASVSRGTREGAPDVTHPDIRRQIGTLLPKALETVLTAGKILTQVSPQLMYLMEPNYAKNGPLTDVAVNRGINFIQVAQIARDDALMFRRLNRNTRREHPSSVAKQTLLQLRDEPWTEQQEAELAQEFDSRYSGKWFLQSRNQPGTEQRGRDEIFARLKLDPAKKVAIVFSHVLWDANLFYGEDLFEDYGDWFVQTVRAAAQNHRVNWLIKLHPANLWKRARENAEDELSEVTLIRKHIGDLPPHVQLLFPNFEINNKSLFSIADYAVTVRGTVSTELPCFGVPVFTAGTGRCHGMGFTIDSTTREEYLERMANIQNHERLSDAVTQLAKRHAHTIFRRRPWLMKSFRASFFAVSKGRHPLDHNLHLNARSIGDIERNGDLKKWAQWAARPELVDYLEK